jgi:hypothetical protein
MYLEMLLFGECKMHDILEYYRIILVINPSINQLQYIWRVNMKVKNFDPDETFFIFPSECCEEIKILFKENHCDNFIEICLDLDSARCFINAVRDSIKEIMDKKTERLLEQEE